MDDNPSEVNKSVICDGHFDLSSIKQVYINTISGSLLGLSSEALRRNKGIKVPPGQNFHYTVPEEGCNLYVFEAGLNPLHAAAIKNNIHIYVIREEKKILIATLSSAHPKVQLDLMMSGDMQLSHTSMRKVVYFNACEFKPMRLYKGSLLKTNKEFWVTKVKPLEEVAFNSMEDEKYHLLKVFPAIDTGGKIDLRVRCGDKYEKIGALTLKGRTFSCNLEYVVKFSLSHTSKTADVIFFGYTVPNMPSLKELCGPPSDKFDRKPAKKSDDPEYQAFVERRGGAEHQMHKLTTVSLVSAPLISWSRPDR